jgi:hypothetical protein
LDLIHLLFLERGQEDSQKMETALSVMSDHDATGSKSKFNVHKI